MQNIIYGRILSNSFIRTCVCLQSHHSYTHADLALLIYQLAFTEAYCERKILCMQIRATGTAKMKSLLRLTVLSSRELLGRTYRDWQYCGVSKFHKHNLGLKYLLRTFNPALQKNTPIWALLSGSIGTTTTTHGAMVIMHLPRNLDYV